MSNTFVSILPLVLLLVVMYFLLIRPQKKKEKEVNSMRSSIQVGDEIITIGGICANVVKTKDESLIVQVGADKVKFEIMRWSVSKVVESAGAPEEAPEEEKKPAMPKRLGKKAAAEEPAEEAVSEAEEKVEEVEEIVEEAE